MVLTLEANESEGLPAKLVTFSLKCSMPILAPILKLSMVTVGAVASSATVVEQPAVAPPPVSRTVALADRTSPTAKAVP